VQAMRNTILTQAGYYRVFDLSKRVNPEQDDAIVQRRVTVTAPGIAPVGAQIEIGIERHTAHLAFLSGPVLRPQNCRPTYRAQIRLE